MYNKDNNGRTKDFKKTAKSSSSRFEKPENKAFRGERDSARDSSFKKPENRNFRGERDTSRDSSFKKPSNYFEKKDREPRVFDEQDDFDEESKNDLIIGRNPVIEALKAEKLIDTLYVNAEGGGSLSHIISMAKEKNIVVKTVNDVKLSSMSNGASHQGVIAVGACAKYVSVEEILEIAREKNESPFIIICDEIEDPHNLGAIIRTAESAGAHGIIIPKRRSASLNHTVFKTSAGAASWLPVARVSNIVTALEELKKSGVWIYGTDACGEDYTKCNLTGSIGLVVGSEGNGIGRLVKEKCDFLLKLPMLGKISSLNASVAGGIFMYEIVRQRQLNSK